MKRNKYTREFENFVRKNVSKYTREDFRLLLQDRYNINLSKDALRRYLNSHCKDVKYLDYDKSKVRKNVSRYEVGTERNRSNGTVIKVAAPDKWRLKHRVMYEKYHGCKLKDNECVIFLNQDRKDFSKENLIKISFNQFMWMHNNNIFSNDPELTTLGIKIVNLKIKAKEILFYE